MTGTCITISIKFRSYSIKRMKATKGQKGKREGRRGAREHHHVCRAVRRAGEEDKSPAESVSVTGTALQTKITSKQH